jgi:hypothetical protein
LQAIQSFPTEGHEFFVTLGKGRGAPAPNRLELLQDAAEESAGGRDSH